MNPCNKYWTNLNAAENVEQPQHAIAAVTNVVCSSILVRNIMMIIPTTKLDEAEDAKGSAFLRDIVSYSISRNYFQYFET